MRQIMITYSVGMFTKMLVGIFAHNPQQRSDHASRLPTHVEWEDDGEVSGTVLF